MSLCRVWLLAGWCDICLTFRWLPSTELPILCTCWKSKFFSKLSPLIRGILYNNNNNNTVLVTVTGFLEKCCAWWTISRPTGQWLPVFSRWQQFQWIGKFYPNGMRLSHFAQVKERNWVWEVVLMLYIYTRCPTLSLCITGLILNRADLLEQSASVIFSLSRAFFLLENVSCPWNWPRNMLWITVTLIPTDLVFSEKSCTTHIRSE